MWSFWFLPSHVHCLLQNTYPFSSYTAIGHITTGTASFCTNPLLLSTLPVSILTPLSPQIFFVLLLLWFFAKFLIFLFSPLDFSSPQIFFSQTPFNSCEELNRFWGFFLLVIIVSFPPSFFFFFFFLCLYHNLYTICWRTLQHWGSVHLWECFLVLCG